MPDTGLNKSINIEKKIYLRSKKERKVTGYILFHLNQKFESEMTRERKNKKKDRRDLNQEKEERNRNIEE